MGYRYIVAVSACMFVAGCVMVGLKTMFPAQKQRDQNQQVNANAISQWADNVSAALPDDASDNARESVALIKTTADDIKREAVVSERWHAAGEKIVGPPPELVNADSREGSPEQVELAKFESEADTVGKVRAAVSTGKQILQGGRGATGGLGGWATGGGLALITAAVGTVTELGRRKLKEQERQRKTDQETAAEEHRKTREAAERNLRERQDERDRQQDVKMDVMTAAINERIAKLEEMLKGKA